MEMSLLLAPVALALYIFCGVLVWWFARPVVGGLMEGVRVTLLWPFQPRLRKERILQNEQTVPVKPAVTRLRVFTPRAKDLSEVLSVQEIEERELVLDPLATVPAVPFGALHTIWRQFLAGLQPGDEIWSFTIHPDSGRALGAEVFGYAAVRDGAIKLHIIAHRG